MDVGKEREQGRKLCTGSADRKFLLGNCPMHCANKLHPVSMNFCTSTILGGRMTQEAKGNPERLYWKEKSCI
jgi:hypothetical protein